MPTEPPKLKDPKEIHHWLMPYEPPKLLVCGLGRCGSSLVMQMFKAGGLRVPGEHPYHEPGKVAGVAGWFEDWDVTKWLNPGNNRRLDPAYQYKCIWLERDPYEQAKSWTKLVENRKPTGVPHGIAMGRTLAIMSERRAAGRERVGKVSIEPVPVLRFETLIQKPDKAAKALAWWADRGLDPEVMAAVVQSRKPSCHPTMLEDEI